MLTDQNECALQAANALEAQAEASFSSAVRDNTEIYHELVPETLPELLAAALAKVRSLTIGRVNLQTFPRIFGCRKIRELCKEMVL